MLLELSLEARSTGGVLYFPPEWDTLSAVHDRIGGDRKEIRKALVVFQIPDSTGAQVLRIVRDETEHRLEITKWEDWAGPKSGSDRSQLSRTRASDRNDLAPLTISKTLQAVAPSLQANSNATPTGQDSTEQYRRESDARVAEPRGETASRTRIRTVPEEPPEAIEPEQPTPTETGYDLARRVWCELWQAKYRGRYEFNSRTGPGSEDYVLKSIGDRALIRQGGAEAFLRHKIGAYLKDHGRNGFLDESKHLIRNLERDWVSYGEPAARLVPRRKLDEAPPVSTDEQRARAMALVSGIGKGGG